MKIYRLLNYPNVKHFCSVVQAADPETGEVKEYAGPTIPGRSAKDAQIFCNENELGYVKVIGELQSSGDFHFNFNFNYWGLKAVATILLLLFQLSAFSQEALINISTLATESKVGFFDSMHIAKIPGDHFQRLHVANLDYIYTPIDSFTYRRDANVYDGDTPIMKINQGFGNVLIERFRMYGIQAPEIWRLITREAGERSRDHLIKLLESYPVLLVYTFPANIPYDFAKGKFGRYLNIIYGLDENGLMISINDRMVEDGFAIYKVY